MNGLSSQHLLNAKDIQYNQKEFLTRLIITFSWYHMDLRFLCSLLLFFVAEATTTKTKGACIEFLIFDFLNDVFIIRSLNLFLYI